MKLSDQVCSLELSKKLVELGVERDSYFWHYLYEDEEEFLNHVYDERTAERLSPFCIKKAPAYTVAELLEVLPWWCDLRRINNGNYRCSGDSDKFNDWYCSENPADAVASMLITLLENGILTRDKIND